MGPKTKKRGTKNEKMCYVVGRVLKTIRDFLAHHEFNAKNRLEIGLGYVGKKSILKSDG